MGAFGYTDILLHLIFTRVATGEEIRCKHLPSSETLCDSSFCCSIYRFFGGRRVLLAEVSYWCWILVTQVLVTGNQGAPALILRLPSIAFCLVRLNTAIYKALFSKSCASASAVEVHLYTNVLFNFKLAGTQNPKTASCFSSHLDPEASLIETPAQRGNLVINQKPPTAFISTTGELHN